MSASTSGKLSLVIKELKQGNIKDQPKAAKNKETSEKPWQRVERQRITQSFSHNSKISFPPLADEGGTEGPITIEAKTGDAEHSTSTWMNFVVVRSPSSYNRIIKSPRIDLDELYKRILKDLQCNTFSGMEENDVVDHIANFLEMLDPVKIAIFDTNRLSVDIFPLSYQSCKSMVVK
nr:hypothetical protein [Tanacetum cinerariifolium]